MYRDITMLTKVHKVESTVFPNNNNMTMKVGPYGRLSAEEFMLSNCGAGE